MSPERSYTIEPKNKLFEAIRGMANFEIRPGVTVTFISEVDLTEIEKIRSAAQLESKQKPSYTAFVAKAVGLALKEFPYANRRVSRRAWLPLALPRIQRFHHADIAVAVERDEPGAESMTFVDILRDADQLNWDEITTRLRALAKATPESNKQWREFRWIAKNLPCLLTRFLLRLPYFFPSSWVKYRGAAVLISSPAKYGVDNLVATWTAPCGISFGLVKQRPIIKNSQIVACTTFNLVLNFDRRVMAGAQAARFFANIVERLQNPLADTN